MQVPNPPDNLLHSTRVDLWQFSLLRTVTESDRACLSKDELLRAQQFYFERHQRRFTVARSTLRLILGHYLSIPSRQIHFGYNTQGKPHLEQCPTPLHFNLSHSNELALLAIGLNHPIGVDIEFFSDRPYEGIGKQLFSDRENNVFNELPNTLKALAFFHLWSQKEAFIKAIGLGLSYPTKQISMPILSAKHQFVDPLHSSQWKMISFMPTPACCAALCYHPSIKDIYYSTRLPPPC